MAQPSAGRVFHQTLSTKSGENEEPQYQALLIDLVEDCELVVVKLNSPGTASKV